MMEPLVHGVMPVLALLMAPPAVYLFSYCLLRLCGVLSVGAGGWHAGSLAVGDRTFFPAFALFRSYRPLLRLESACARKWKRSSAAGAAEQVVSDVVVEVVSMA